MPVVIAGNIHIFVSFKQGELLGFDLKIIS